MAASAPWENWLAGVGLLRKRVRQVGADQGVRKDLLTSGEREEIRR
jgi:hypothetical protein